MKYFLLLFLGAVGCTQWYVSHFGLDDMACGSSVTPCATLDHAYGLTSEGDTINVASSPWTYDPLSTKVTHSLTILGDPIRSKVGCPKTPQACTFWAQGTPEFTLTNLELTGCNIVGVVGVCLDNVVNVSLLNISYHNNTQSGGFWLYEYNRKEPNFILWDRVQVTSNQVNVKYPDLVSLNTLNTEKATYLFQRLNFRKNTGGFNLNSNTKAVLVRFSQVKLRDLDFWILALNYYNSCFIGLEDSVFSTIKESTLQCGRMSGDLTAYRGEMYISRSTFYQVHHSIYGYSLAVFLGPDFEKGVNLLRVVSTEFIEGEDTGLRVFSFPSVSVFLREVKFLKNQGDLGGGFYFGTGGVNSSVVLNECVFQDNLADQGGGLATYQVPSVFITGCTFQGNIGLNGVHDMMIGVTP